MRENHVYIHHSGRFAAYTIKEKGQRIHEGVQQCHPEGYTEGVLNCAIDALSLIPEDESVYFHSPVIKILTAKKGKRGDYERDIFANLCKGRDIYFVEALETDANIVIAKKIAHEKAKQQHTQLQTFDYIGFTDGSCNNLSPFGEGGAAYVIIQNGEVVKSNSKGFMGVTNNRMEMLAIISAVNAIPEGSSIKIHTDSQYCIGVFSPGYQIKPKTKNPDLIDLFRKIASTRKVSFEWVKGHAGNKFNEMVDQLASARTEEMRFAHNIPIYDRFTSPKCNKAGQ